LDSIPERVLDIWWAYYQCEPFGSHWEQTASIAAMVSANTTMLAATRGVECESASVLDFLPGDSMPWEKRKKRQKKKGLRKPQEQIFAIKNAFGFR
jgi:hypothetical protein